MKEYDLFIPLNYNDGSPIEPRKLQRLQARLLGQFNGLTFFPQASVAASVTLAASSRGIASNDLHFPTWTNPAHHRTRLRIPT